MFAVLFVGRFSLLNSFCSLLLALLLASRYFLLWSRCSLFSARSSLSLLATDHLRLTVHLRILLLADNHPPLADCLLSLTGGYLYRVSCHSLHHTHTCGWKFSTAPAPAPAPSYVFLTAPAPAHKTAAPKTQVWVLVITFFVLYDRDKSFHEKKIISVVKKKIQKNFFSATPREHQGGTEGVKFNQICYFLNIYAWKTVQIIPIYTIEIVSSEWALSGILPIF